MGSVEKGLLMWNRPKYWNAAWVMQNNGEVFSCKYRITVGGMIVIQCRNGRYLKGNGDGTVSKENEFLEWWPDMTNYRMVDKRQ